jgi:hypothetical protein
MLSLLVAYVSPAVADGYSLNAALFGRWRVEGQDSATILVLSADGTWAAKVKSLTEAGELYEVGGAWLTDEHYIHWAYKRSSSPWVKPGARDKDTIIEIGHDYFVLENHAGKRHKYVRVKQDDNASGQN